MTPSDAVQGYLDYLETERRLSWRTVRSYRQELRQLVRVLGDQQILQLQEVHRAHVVAYLNRPHPLGGTLAPGTRNRKLIVLHGFFQYARQQGWIARDPTRKVSWVRDPGAEQPVLTPAEFDQLVARLKQRPASRQRTRDLCILTVLTHTGIRLSELTGLDVEHLHLSDQPLLRVRRKGGRSQSLPLNETTRQALEAWLKERAQAAPSTNALFISRRGGRLAGRTIQEHVKKLREQAGLASRITPHACRHGFTTTLLERGAQMEEVKQLLGHRSILTTSRYAHPTPEALRRAVQRLDEKDE